MYLVYIFPIVSYKKTHVLLVKKSIMWLCSACGAHISFKVIFMLYQSACNYNLMKYVIVVIDEGIWTMRYVRIGPWNTICTEAWDMAPTVP